MMLLLFFFPMHRLSPLYQSSKLEAGSTMSSMEANGENTLQGLDKPEEPIGESLKDSRVSVCRTMVIAGKSRFHFACVS